MSLAFLHAHDCSEPHADAVWGVAWTAADTALSVSADGAVRQWASASGQPHPPNAPAPAPHTLAQVSLSVAPDGARAVTNSIEGRTALWDLGKGERVAEFESFARAGGEEGGEPAWAVALHPGGDVYAATGAAGNATVRSAAPASFGARRATLASGRPKFGMACAYSPDGRRLALASETGQVFVFDAEAGTLALTFASHAMAVRTLAWAPDSNLLLTGSEDKRLVLHDVRSAPGAAVASLAGHTSWVLSADISPDGRLGLSGSADKSIKVWDIGARAAVASVQDTGEVWAVAWRPRPPAAGSPGAFVSGGEDGVVRWWRGAGSGA